MQALLVPILGVLLLLLAVAGVARHFSASGRQRNALSVVLVVLGLVTAFFLFFGAGSWFRSHRAQPRPHASMSSHVITVASRPAPFEPPGQPSAIARPELTLHPHRYQAPSSSCAIS